MEVPDEVSSARFSLLLRHMDMMTQITRRFRVASGGEDCHMSRVVAAGIEVLAGLSDDDLVPAVQAVPMRRAGHRSAARTSPARSPRPADWEAMLAMLARCDAVLADTDARVEAVTMRLLYTHDRSEFVFRILDRARPTPLTNGEIIGSARRIGYGLTVHGVAAHLNYLKHRVGLQQDGGVERYAIREPASQG